ncbi:chemotaxis protein CheC [Clostridium pascui]|uniref:chemotaxis protein CheC n=1 Tax=Clostridium pascui TaxID=46609 RepID=UPI00195B5ED9|nr:chemotaxis protein CheC [Clostridium pascui]MBM7869470.1 chemotaxis protein CheC [Clostridium pascui]
MSYKDLTPLQLDALREVGNIGAGNAATALSQLLIKKVDMSVPAINIISFEDIFSNLSGEEIVYGVLVRVLGDAPGNILLVLKKNTAMHVIEALTGQKGEDINEMGESVLAEIGNILSATYMNAIGRFTNLSIIPSVPALTYDMLGAILSTTFIESGQFDEYVLDIETAFIEGESEINAHFYYIPMPGSLEKILNTLGVI